MKTNWLRITNRINAERFQVPDGWETREQVAESLQCAVDKVADILKAGIQAGDIERATFPVWSDSRRMAIPTTCYREARGSDAPQAQPDAKPSIPQRIEEAIRRFPGHSNSEIAKRFHLKHGVKAATVAAIRAKMG